MTLWLLIPLLVVLFAGLVLTAAGLFGNTVIFGAIVFYATITGFSTLGVKAVLIIGLLYGAGELLEYVFTLMGVQWLGASRAAGWMSILGTIVGAICGGTMMWGVGVIIGGFLGAILGALLTELILKRRLWPAVKAGLGAFMGKAGAMLVKLVIAVIIILYTVRSIYAGSCILQ